jgi:hypothetical protein
MWFESKRIELGTVRGLIMGFAVIESPAFPLRALELSDAAG